MVNEEVGQNALGLNFPTTHVQNRLCNLQPKSHSNAFGEVLVYTKLSQNVLKWVLAQSFFFPKTSKNPIQPGNPKLNDTSFTPDEFARAKKIKSKCSQPKYFWEEKGLRLITAKLQFMVFQKYCSEKSEMHYWYIIHNKKEISVKILKFQQCVPSQSPTNHPIWCHLVYQCLCTKKKITQFKWKFVKTLPIISVRLYAAEPYIDHWKNGNY